MHAYLGYTRTNTHAYIHMLKFIRVLTTCTLTHILTHILTLIFTHGHSIISLYYTCKKIK